MAKKSLLREDTPYAIRVVIAAGAFALAIAGWLRGICREVCIPGRLTVSADVR